MESNDSVTHWIERLKAGDQDEAAQALWERYFEKLVRLARRNLEGTPRRIADEEDVALSAFKSFCKAAQKGRFPDLRDRDSLWRLLISMTIRKAIDLKKYNAAGKRKGIVGESVIRGPEDEPEARAIEQFMGESPTPEFSAMMAEGCGRLLDRLGEPKLRELAVGKLEGYTDKELAERLDCSVRTIERRLRLIRKTWEEELAA